MRRKTDKADALKIVSYALTWWPTLPEYISGDGRHMLKAYIRQYSKYFKIKSMPVNNFIYLIGLIFPEGAATNKQKCKVAVHLLCLP